MSDIPSSTRPAYAPCRRCRVLVAILGIVHLFGQAGGVISSTVLVEPLVRQTTVRHTSYHRLMLQRLVAQSSLPLMSLLYCSILSTFVLLAYAYRH